MKTEISDEIRDTMNQVLAAGGFSTSEAAAWEVSLTIALAKVSQYERECGRFRQQYGEPLASLQKRVENTIGTEDFLLEDNLADWEFAEQALALWKARVEVLRCAVA